MYEYYELGVFRLLSLNYCWSSPKKWHHFMWSQS